MQTIKNRLRKLETRHQPKTGELPMVVADETTASKLMRLRNQHPDRLVFRFSESPDLFI